MARKSTIDPRFPMTENKESDAIIPTMDPDTPSVEDSEETLYFGLTREMIPQE